MIANFDANYLKTLIGAAIAASYICWWIWVVYACLGLLRANQITIMGLLSECSRSFLSVIGVLAIFTFL